MRVSLLRALRSRALASALLVGVTAYMWVSTLVPLTSVDPEAAALWDTAHPSLAPLVRILGLHAPFANPIFIAAVVVVALSTAACAWERTRGAFTATLAPKPLSPTQLTSLESSPKLMFPLEQSALSADVMHAAAAVLRRMHLRVRLNDDVLTASGGWLSLLGSALFHWAIVGVIVFAAAGQLTRYEGYSNIVIGRSVVDAREAYETDFIAGPLFGGRFSGLELGVEDINLEFEADGIERGASPLVTISRNGRPITSEWVYPNNPIRADALVVHRAAVNPAFSGTLVSEGNGTRPVTLYFDFMNREPSSFEIPDDLSTRDIVVAVAPLGNQRVEATVTSAEGVVASTVRVGDTVALTEDLELRVDDLTYFAQLHIVRDWSVPWVYAMFVAGCAGTALALFVPRRSVHMIVVNDADRRALHVTGHWRRTDAEFPERLRTTLERVLGPGHTNRQESDQ